MEAGVSTSSKPGTKPVVAKVATTATSTTSSQMTNAKRDESFGFSDSEYFNKYPVSSHTCAIDVS